MFLPFDEVLANMAVTEDFLKFNSQKVFEKIKRPFSFSRIHQFTSISASPDFLTNMSPELPSSLFVLSVPMSPGFVMHVTFSDPWVDLQSFELEEKVQPCRKNHRRNLSGIMKSSQIVKVGFHVFSELPTSGVFLPRRYGCSVWGQPIMELEIIICHSCT